MPGVRRYVQNHAIPDVYPRGRQTHDGWSELWFDDLRVTSIARSRRHSGRCCTRMAATLFARPMGIGVARERIQKDSHWTYNDWGVGLLDEEGIVSRLRAGRFSQLAADPGSASGDQDQAAAADSETLAVWSDEHLVTIDESRIDAPSRGPARRSRGVSWR